MLYFEMAVSAYKLLHYEGNTLQVPQRAVKRAGSIAAGCKSRETKF